MKNIEQQTNPGIVKFKRTVTGILFGASIIGLSVLPASVAQAVTAKAITVEAPSGQKKLDVDFESTKDTYKVGEPIRFRVKGNQKFFLYVYSVDEDGEAVLLLPNERQDGNKYPGNRRYMVPNKNVEFVADAPGNEEIIMIASKKYLEVSEDRLNKAAGFLMGSVDMIESEFSSKGIEVRKPTKRREGVVVKRMEIDIKGKRANDDDDDGDDAFASTGQPFISGNKKRYDEGDTVRLTYGANNDGWVHLYVVEPGGSYSRMKRKKVKADKAYHIKATAESPTGRHAVVAVYSKEKQIDAEDVLEDKALPMSIDDFSSKGLGSISDEDESKLSTAVFRFYIRN